MEVTVDEFFELVAHFAGVSIAEAQKQWDDLPLGHALGSPVAGLLTKTEENRAMRHSSLRMETPR